MASKTAFLWLGANRARKWPVGAKARLLDRAAWAGLPTPPGGILLDEFYRLLLAAGVVQMQEGVVAVTDAGWLHETLYQGARFPRVEKPLILRPAFSAGGAPIRHEVTGVSGLNLSDPIVLARGLTAVWSVPHAGPDLRRDLLVTEVVETAVSGTAVTTPQAPDVVHYQAAGEPPSSLSLPHLPRFRRPVADLPPFARRLQQLLRGVRRTFGPEPWQVAWLDDGRICWLIQLTQASG